MPSGSSAHGRDAQRKAAQLLREQRASERRRRTATWSIIGAVVVLAVAAITVTIALNAKPTASASSTATPANTAIGKVTAPPWTAPTDATTRAKAAGVEMLNSEGTVEHIHSHLSVTVDGKSIAVPALIGIDERAQTISPLHTHDTSGIIHVESPVKETFTLGQFFTEWNVALNAKEIGSLGTASGETITTFVDGKRISGNPAAITLADREDVDIVVTQPGATATVPPRYSWPAGY